MSQNELRAYRRHLKSCPDAAKGQNFTLCECPIYVIGILNGEPVRRSLQTNEWPRAMRRIEVLLGSKESADAILPPPPARTITTAAAAYLADAQERNLRPATLRSYKRALDHLIEFCGKKPIGALDLDLLSDFRSSRDIKPRTQRKEIEYLRGFCAFCVTRGWMDRNPAKQLRPPRVDDIGTMPFTREEVSALVSACDRMRGMWKEDRPFVRKRAKALVLTLLYSGLRVGDVAQLQRNALLPSGHLVLRIMKTGAPLKVLLHEDAVQALRSLPAPGGNPNYFFWSGHGDIDDCSKSLWRTISRVGKVANVHAHPHRFRDTFAVELLTNEVDIRTVQLLLGHSSVQITERHYAHFVKAHQGILDRAASTLNFQESARPLLVDPKKNRLGNA